MIAAGLTPEGDARRKLLHAGTCPRCGALLKQAIADFSDQITPEEEKELESLQTSRPEWQEAFARRLSGSAAHEAARNPSSSAPVYSKAFRQRIAIAACSLAVISLIVVWWTAKSRGNSPERLLAKAYSEQRTMELRIPLAQYAPVRVERTAGESAARLSRPSELLEVEAQAKRELTTHPDSAKWLNIAGNAELLEWNYEAAIADFSKGLEVEQNSAELQVGLASAYAQRAEALDRVADYATAAETLGKVLLAHADNEVALFNRAIVMQRMFLYQQAEHDWNEYLKLDSTGPWAAEARERLRSLREKMNGRGDLRPAPLLRPAEVVRRVDVLHPGTWTALDDRVEEYLDSALTRWLPAAYSTQPSKARLNIDARAALGRLSLVLERRHDDAWLAEMLAVHPSPVFANAVLLLAEAVRSGSRGDYGSTLRFAAAAQSGFERSGTRVGWLRARLEHVYALQVLQQGGQCWHEADALARDLQGRRYRWLQIQTELELAVCRNLLGDIGASRALAARARTLAEQARYPLLELRARDFVAGFTGAAGERELAWNEVRSGLAIWWGGRFPPMPGYNFYAVADDLANASEQWHLDLAIARQMVATAAATDDLPLGAMARERLGQTALMAGYPELAKSELRNVKSMLQAAPQQETLRTAAVEATVELARLEIERGEVAAARSDLLSVENAVPHVASRFVASNFYQTRSRLLHLAGDLTGAEESLHAALAIAETELHSLHSDAERLSWKKQTANTYRSLVDLAWNADRPLSALEAWEWYRGANLRARGLSAPKRAGPALKLASAKDSRVSPPPLVRNLLPSLTRQTVLSYAILPDSLIVWAFDDRGITARRIPIRGEELARRARHFYALCSNQHSDLGALREEGRRLYEVLLAPIRDHLDAERALVIEPDNWVSFVPFEALVDAQGRYVSDTYAIAYLPGLRYMTGLRESTPIAAGARALVVGDPSTVDPHLHSLADAAREAEQVHRSIGGQLLTGKQATLKNIERDLPDSVVFHFAGHAAGSAEQVGLVLTNVDASEPTFLTAATLGAMRLRKLQLAVLSACTTEGKVADAESLPRVLLQAGVPHVIATQWNVDSASTAGFMDHFYTALLSGKPVSGALRVAAAEARNTPGFSHPYFWSAFHLLGRE